MSLKKTFHRKSKNIDTGQEWIPDTEVSRITGVSLQTLRNNRNKRIGFPYYKIGRAVRYKKSEIYELMEKHRVFFG